MNLPLLAAGALSCVASALVTAAPAHAQGVELFVDAGDPLAPFQDINDAIAAALPGDTISVHTGTYAPFFVATDDLWIRRATPTSQPVVDGNGSVGINHAIFVVADGVVIEGFELRGFVTSNNQVADGCLLLYCDHARLIDILAVDFQMGFVVIGGTGLDLIGNVAADCLEGFQLVDCERPTLKRNSASGSTGSGLLSVNSNGGNFTGNWFDACDVGISAIVDVNCTYEGNIASNGGTGIQVVSCTGCAVRNNLATFNLGDGFGLYFGATAAPASHDNLFQANSATDNGGFGFEADPGAVHNKFRDNAASGNALGGANVSWIL